MDEEKFKKLFQRIIDMYQISPETAAELLQRILVILSNKPNESDSL